MREKFGAIVENGRILEGAYATMPNSGRKGAFRIPCGSATLLAICGTGMGWEHVSISIAGEKRTPTWEEMCFAKSLFWHDEEAVIQYHPPKSQYVNDHKYVLHLWKPSKGSIRLPDKSLVGGKDVGRTITKREDRKRRKRRAGIRTVRMGGNQRSAQKARKTVRDLQKLNAQLENEGIQDPKLQKLSSDTEHAAEAITLLTRAEKITSKPIDLEGAAEVSKLLQEAEDLVDKLESGES